MDRAALLATIFWQVQATWHLRQPPTAQSLTVQETVQGLQAWLLAEHGVALQQTLQHVFGAHTALAALARLEIAFYQEGREQRVWRAQATLRDGVTRSFGLIVARAPGPSDALTRRDFQHLQQLYALQPRYCVQPYVCGTMPSAAGVAAYTVEWLDDYKELVFDIRWDGGVFLVNAHGAQRRFTPQESRQIWRHLVSILWWYPALGAVNIQAGDFVGRVLEDGGIALKLTTAREWTTPESPAARIHAMLGWMITASGYLGDGQRPFDRAMTRETFLQRMHAVLRRRFGERAPHLAAHLWETFHAGAFAQQEEHLKRDCILGTYDRWRAETTACQAWQYTRDAWLAYARAVEAGQWPLSWWFPAADIPVVLAHLAPHLAEQE